MRATASSWRWSRRSSSARPLHCPPPPPPQPLAIPATPHEGVQPRPMQRADCSHLNRPRRRGAELAVEAEEPDAVTMCRSAEGAARRDEHDVLLALVLEHRRGRIGTGSRLELPELCAVASIISDQPSVVVAHEYESACRGDRAAVAAVIPLLLPRDRVRPHVHRGKRAAHDVAIGRVERAAEEVVALANVSRVVLHLAAREDRDRVGRADVQVSRLRVVARRRPVRSADRARPGDDTCLPPEGSEDLALVDVVPFRRGELVVAAGRLRRGRAGLGQSGSFLRRDRLGRERVTHRVRLGLGRVLTRLLRNGLVFDSDERLAVRPVEDVDPTRLARLRESMAQLTVDLHVEEHHRRGRVEVPDVVADLLEMPPVLARLRVDGDDRVREQVVALAGAAVEVG